eukprot:scaffold2763_cov88-Skeletonema_dohrnii-CCMP3373.AAC.6
MRGGRQRRRRYIPGGRGNSARVQLAKSKNDFQRKGTLDLDAAHREEHFKPIKPKCNPHGRRETTLGGILARMTIRVANLQYSPLSRQAQAILHSS